jgi:glycerol-3-phosphate acyltransferase PlsX
VARETHKLLKRAPGLNYIGNVEGRDILGHPKHGRVDVIVCDGFVGNIVLKFYESAARLVVGIVRREAPDVLTRDDFGRVLRFLDYSEYGGAPLLGVKGVTIMCHGSSSANAIKNAIRIAAQAVESQLNLHISAQFAQRAAATSA